LEAVFGISLEKLPALDMRVAEQAVAQQIDEEKKRDEVEHSTPVNLDVIACKVLDFPEIEDRRKDLRDIMETLPSASNFREDLILYLKKWLIVDFALRYNFKKILFGTTGHKVATNLLAQLAKGRGASISHEISYIDDKNFNGRVIFMNPMREFLHKEIALYNYLNRVEIIHQKPLA
jgi:tRNA(Ile)-lysidine synthase TilS/MesJ